jgi:hypothetical protein
MIASTGPAVVTRAGLRAFTDASDPTINRWTQAGLFPAPTGHINGRRIWSRAHLVEWENGRCNGWSGHDAGFAERQAAAKKRTEALKAWHASQRAESAAA